MKTLREGPADWAEAGITQEEALSDAWLPCAGRDSDTLVVACLSGRVFTCGKDAPPLRLAFMRGRELLCCLVESADHFLRAPLNIARFIRGPPRPIPHQPATPLRHVVKV